MYFDRCLSCAVAIFVSVAFGALALQKAVAAPNIIHIIADDFGWVDLSADSTNYGNGSNYYQTPNLEELASRGMSFTSAYTCQNCVPTRAALLTGQYAPRTGIHNVGDLNRNGNDTLLVGPADGEHISNSAITLAETLSAAGYTTAHFGKFHVADNRADVSTQHGFEVNMEVGNGASGTAHMAVNSGGAWTFGVPEYDVYAQPYTQSYVNTFLAPYANGNNPNTLVGTAKHLVDGVTDAATAFVATHAGGTEPFYMNLAYSAVHAPITPRADLAAKYNALPSTDPRHTDPNYAAFVETLDQAVGRVMAAVNDPNGDGSTSDSIAENTLLVFTSDNGGHMGATDNTPLRESKGTQREGGLRVPLIAVMPGTIAAGTISEEAIHAVDYYPTYADLAGASLPSPQNHVLDGESFAGILRGDKSDLNRDAVFWHFPGYLDDRSVPTSLITKDVAGKRFKLLYFYEDQRYELFNLSDDLSETNDLLGGWSINQTNYDVARQMSADLRNWLDDQNATYPTVRATGAPVPPPTPLPVNPPPPADVVFDLADPAADGKITHQLNLSGVTLTLTAVGNAAVLDSNNNGVGVDSGQDSGTATVQRRIDGSLATPEEIRFQFDADVILRSVLVGSLETNGSESLRFRFVSGTNPFTGLSGYTGDYDLAANSLTYTTSTSAALPLTVSFGLGSQDDLVLRRGTVLTISANPAVGGGILFDAISVRPFLGSDYNNNGAVDAADYVLWRNGGPLTNEVPGTTPGSNTLEDYAGWRARFGNTPGNGSGVGGGAVPEPSAGIILLLAMLTGITRRSK